MSPAAGAAGGAELFPLPVPSAGFDFCTHHFSRKVRARASRRSHVDTRLRDGVIALNEIYGGAQQSPPGCTEAQSNSIGHLRSGIVACLPPTDVCKPDEALGELLRSRPGYVDDISNLAAYDRVKLSIRLPQSLGCLSPRTCVFSALKVEAF